MFNQYQGIRGSTPGLLGGGQQGLLGQQGQSQTQDLMRQYLMQLFMRQYNPPAIPQQPGMVSSQMGPGGMQYRAPTIPQAANDPLRQQQAQQSQQQAANPGSRQYGMVPGLLWNPNDGQFSG